MPVTPVFDNWSSLDYKKQYAERRSWQAPTWVHEDARRRLEAYKLLHAYLDNVARHYLDTTDDDLKARRREYGDAQLIVDSIVDAVLGDDFTIVVTGAGNDDEPDAQADALQEWFDLWNLDERPGLSFLEAECDAVGLGDAIYELALDAIAGRPTITVYDPGFYFPDIPDDAPPTQFPTRVHLAWEYELETDRDHVETFVRRVTYELVTLESPVSYPWNSGPTQVACLKSDGTWPVRSMERRTVFDLDPSKAVWATTDDGTEVRDLVTGFDFIPVVHMPNSTARKEHFGKSSLTTVLQILDELHSADTDLALTARIVGFPALSVDGALPVGPDGRTITTYGPGTVLGGKASIIDTSSSLDALLKYIDKLLRRLDTNARLSAAVTGREDAQEFSSGIHMAIASGPLKSMVRRMRMVRDEKYPLLLKFVARIGMLLEEDPLPASADLPRIELQFGAFMPSDTATEVGQIMELFRAKLLSRLTAIKLLIALGLSIEDAEEEVTRIEHEDFEGAEALRSAVGDEAAADYLDREVEEVEEEPPPVMPVVPQPGTVPDGT